MLMADSPSEVSVYANERNVIEPKFGNGRDAVLLFHDGGSG